MGDEINGVKQVETLELGISGMTCENCAHRVEKALRSVAGVQDVRVDSQTEIAAVTFDSSRTDVAVIRQAVLKSGYTVKQQGSSI
jgi:P-type Cu+ transporter